MNLSPKARPWMLSSTTKFFAVWGRTFGENDLNCGARAIGCSMMTMHPHRALVTREFLAHKGIITLPHPPYSPDLAPCDFVLFPKMKLQLKGCCFDRVEEIQRESQNVLGTLQEQDFQHAFQQWQQRWDRCVAAQGDYFEGGAAQT